MKNKNIYQDIFYLFYLLWFEFLTNCSHISFSHVFSCFLREKKSIISALISPLSSSNLVGEKKKVIFWS